MTPRFSCIVPHYQPSIPHEIYCRGIECLRRQRFTQPIEIIALHDGPFTDPDVDWSSTIKPIPTPVRFNDWGHSLRDIGIWKATGEYIIHFNPDNTLIDTAFREIDFVLRRQWMWEGDYPTICIFPIKMVGVQMFLRNGIHTEGRDVKAKDIYTIRVGLPPMLNNIDCLQLVAKRELWLSVGGWYDKSQDSDGKIYERLCRENNYRACGPVLGEHR